MITDSNYNIKNYNLKNYWDAIDLHCYMIFLLYIFTIINLYYLFRLIYDEYELA